MAILQISRITQRKGLAQDLPQPLAGAELGWAIDDRKLYIGNGDLAEGAPVVGNTEVLTEFSEILSYANQYTYQGAAAGYVVQTGATSGAPVTQSLQSRLDSYVIVTDFGATGDGVTDDTAAINRALYQLYCRQVNPQIRRGLYFPAGNYLVTDTILVPPYANLYGDGADSSIINFEVNPWAALTAYAQGVLVSYSGSYYRSIIDVPPTETSSPNAATEYWLVESAPDYVMRTADSLQQTGVSIATNGATAPQSVEVTDMCFITNLNINGVLVEDATRCYFNQVNVIGPLTTTTLATASPVDISAIAWASAGSYPCSQVNFDNCYFSGFSYGMNTDQVINGATISNSQFDTLWQGIVLDTDPTGVRIMHNVFDNIYSEGIAIVGANLNASAYNTFFDVGNHFQGYPITSGTSTAVIDIDAENNISVGDLFQRTTAQAAIQPRIALNNSTSAVFGMNMRGIALTISGASNTTVANQLQIGKYTRSTGIQSTLNDNDSGTLFVVSTSISDAINAFKMDYTITRSANVRTGTITVVKGPTFTYTDDYVENAVTGITLTASEASPGGNITMAYASSSTGSSGEISYSITHLA